MRKDVNNKRRTERFANELHTPINFFRRKADLYI